MATKQTPEQIAEAKAIKAAEAKAVKDAKAVEATAAKEAKAKAAADAKAVKDAKAAAGNDEAVKAEKAAKVAEAKALKEAEKAAKTALATQAKLDKAAAKEANKMPQQNGVRRPKPDGKCGQAWAAMDYVSKQKGSPAAIAEVLAVTTPAGLSEGNVKAEYAMWRKFNGVVGRVTPTTAPVAQAS